MGGMMGLFIKIINDGTGTKEIGHYDYKVLVNDTVIDSGRVENYERFNRWDSLLRRVVDDREKKDSE